MANYRLAAELTAIRTTTDGRCAVIGTLDGCLSVLAIADPTVPDSYQFLASLPSRTRQATAHVPTTQSDKHHSNDDEKSDEEFESENGQLHQESNSFNSGHHFTLKTAAVIAAGFARATRASSQENSAQKVTSKTCVIS